MEKKLNSDLSNLSNIPENILDKLSELTTYVISSSVYESLLNKEGMTEIDLGFGNLLIKHDTADIKMKFIPNDILKEDLKKINNGGKPGLYRKLEKAVSAKLKELYKEMF